MPMDDNVEMLRGCRHGTQSTSSDMSLSAQKFYGARQFDGALQCNLRLSCLSEQVRNAASVDEIHWERLAEYCSFSQARRPRAFQLLTGATSFITSLAS